ncbi:hypothetical protein [Staphylococcus caprae]|uniref:hypothetical protein n=1 Tax=Staphylococcus caprae TaxID=29380 RepID=UPI000CD1EF8C|nr:hypothetical protein [Staphylococcus caprae]POA06086.1 hypothetical protein CD155_03840 [Staphylococcus caprae]SUL89828.1 Uncharacterised protein [Staphylococcus caprae]
MNYTPSPSELRKWYEKELYADIEYVSKVAKRNNEDYETVMHRYQKAIIEYIAMETYFNQYPQSEYMNKHDELKKIQVMIAEVVGVDWD